MLLRPIRPDDLRLYIVSDDADEAPGPPVHLHCPFGVRLLFLRDWLCSALAACGAASVTSWRSTEKILSLWSWQLLHKRHGGTKLSRVIPLNLWPQLLHREEQWREPAAGKCWEDNEVLWVDLREADSSGDPIPSTCGLSSSTKRSGDENCKQVTALIITFLIIQWLSYSLCLSLNCSTFHWSRQR